MFLFKNIFFKEEKKKKSFNSFISLQGVFPKEDIYIFSSVYMKKKKETKKKKKSIT